MKTVYPPQTKFAGGIINNESTTTEPPKPLEGGVCVCRGGGGLTHSDESKKQAHDSVQTVRAKENLS